jgi:hypothetical protein
MFAFQIKLPAGHGSSFNVKKAMRMRYHVDPLCMHLNLLAALVEHRACGLRPRRQHTYSYRGCLPLIVLGMCAPNSIALCSALFQPWLLIWRCTARETRRLAPNEHECEAELLAQKQYMPVASGVQLRVRVRFVTHCPTSSHSYV